MRQVILVIVLVAAAFLGGAFVNGPGLRWAQTQLLGSLGLVEGGEIVSVDLGGPPNPADNLADDGAPAAPARPKREGPIAPVPTLRDGPEAEAPAGPARSARAEGPSSTSRSPSTAKIDAQTKTASAMSAAPALATTVSGPSASSSPTSSPSPSTSPPPLDAPLSFSHNAANTNANANTAANAGGEADAPPPVLDFTHPVAVASASTKEPEPAPASTSAPADNPPASASATAPADGENWAALAASMKRLGVSRFTIMGEVDGPIVCSCLVPLAGRKAVAQQFQAEGPDVFQAARAALRRVALWRATQPGAGPLPGKP